MASTAAAVPVVVAACNSCLHSQRESKVPLKAEQEEERAALRGFGEGTPMGKENSTRINRRPSYHALQTLLQIAFSLSVRHLMRRFAALGEMVAHSSTAVLFEWQQPDVWGSLLVCLCVLLAAAFPEAAASAEEAPSGASASKVSENRPDRNSFPHVSASAIAADCSCMGLRAAGLNGCHRSLRCAAESFPLHS
ncbi:hypothetical protein cyc_07105 [Cyclospora cayetanensis]|uniref:Uncharacterized protein n=1 Tax=Cyclospora cayetanensis TaxID=88456 RepID=A0A1D3CUM7_9EIME|nr:hypothetical protein cyc_07105 [Cyclospora cayetanensis]